MQEAHRYDPEKARQLLADAGYPDGLHFTVDVSVSEVEALIPIQAMLAEVDVDMELLVREHSTYVSLWYGREYAQSVYGFSWEVPPFIGRYMSDATSNYSFMDDPQIDELVPQVYAAFMEADQYATLIQTISYDHVAVQLPTLMNVMILDYIMWWPWVRDYTGEWAIGYGGNQWPNFYMYIWLDTEMKKEMGY